jgi:formylglycine-generating enzyme required for sulfatase activity
MVLFRATVSIGLQFRFIMGRLPPLTSRIDRGAESGGEFERLLNQLLLCHADRHNFEYEPAGGAGGDGGIDGLVRRGGVPGLQGPVAFQFKWLWDGIHKGSKARQVADSLTRAAQASEIQHWVLVTPHDLTPAENDWLLARSPRADIAVHHWGQTRLEGLLRDYCPALFARYYPHEAKAVLTGYDGHEFSEFASDYRSKLAIAHRRLRTIGLPPETLREQDITTEIPLRRIFVPQRFASQHDRDRIVNLGELLGTRSSCVLLGDPGLGKSTVLSFLALLLCGEADLSNFDRSPEIVPLLIPIRDFLKLRQQHADLGFLEYLASRARSDLNLPHAHRAFFEATLRMGEALVLIDGLDEAGGDASRQRIATAIQTFHAQFPQCPCWVTSRIYGYTQAARLPADSFAHYRVERLETQQIDDFIARWYAIQYPDNPREREERVRSLQHAVQRTPGVQRLAGNPLLLTLMAFIHHGQRTLPQDRGDLYEQCVQMLLNSWQEAKREGESSAGGAGAPHPFETIGLHVATQKDYLAHLAMCVQERNQSADEDEGRGLIRRTDALDCLARRHLDRSLRTRPGIELGEAREEMEQFLDYVSDRTGLLVDKGGGQLSFIHLSFQEYLAAWLYTYQPPSEHEQRQFFETHLGQPAWEEVLLLRLYVMLRLPGGGGDTLFDAVVSSLLGKLERHPDRAGWLSLARAVRDNLEFGAVDRKAILERILGFWMESPPRFDSEWFTVLEEVCLFSPEGKSELQGLLEDRWRQPKLADAAASLHLLDRLALTAGKSRVHERPDLGERFDDLVLEGGMDSGWRSTLSFVFECLVGAAGPERAIATVQNLARRVQLPAAKTVQRGQQVGVWNVAIVLGDCLQMLVERQTPIPDNLTNFFQTCVFQAVEQEIAIEDRQTLAVTLGRLGDPRIEVDLRLTAHPDEHPGYVKIPAGTYPLGEEKKAVSISEPFWLSKYPVTNSQYELFVQDGGYSRQEFWSDEGWKWVQDNHIALPGRWRNADFNSPNQPVVGVSCWEAEAFCRWASGVLPTEQQWEAAACGPAGLVYPWGDDWESGICNSENKLGRTSAVGIFPRDKSPFGLHDMAGNVWEWCADVWEAGGRVIRGGGWGNDSQFCRSAARGALQPSSRGESLGFRVAAVPLGSVPDRQQTAVAQPGAQAEGRRAQRSGAARPSSRSGRRSGG